MEPSPETPVALLTPDTEPKADSPLDALARLAVEAGAEDIAADAGALAERVGEGRFYIACVGQFKRGKSTLLNALIGEPILPTGVVPVTAVVTVLRHGSRRGARVRFAGNRWQAIDPASIAEYVSEERNPENEKGVAAVEVFVPSPLLASGMCLVDTPGIGSVFAGNAAATRAFVPHIDAALVVLGADPPISGEELTLVEEVARHVRDLIFVLNKADRLSDVERREASRFTERLLARRLERPVGPILEVSAAERLAGAGPARDWGALCRALERLAGQAGSALVRAAEARGLGLLVDRLLRELEEQRGALLRPLEESERRIEALRHCVADAERSMADLAYLFAGEQERLARAFAEQQDRFLARARPAALEELREAIVRAAERRGRALRRRALLLAQETSERWLDHWLKEEQPAAETMYRKAGERFVQLANGFLERLAASGVPALDHLPGALGPEVGFRAKSRLYYTELLPLVQPTPLERLLDLLRPRALALRALERDAGRYLEELLASNSTRIRNDLEERVLESRRQLEAEIHSRLRAVYASAERALALARARQAAGAQAVQAEIDRIDALRREVEALRPAPVDGAGR